MEYEIRQSAVTAEPKPGHLYTDSDGDLFLFVGGGTQPWVQFCPSGLVKPQPEDYPNGPLTEEPADAEEYARLIDAKLF